MLQLQRSVGNAAVAQLVQRAPSGANRQGAKWAYGPITKRKSKENDLITYLGWIKEVEAAYGADKQAVLQRLRRLYYSTHSGSAGAKFDKVIADQAGAEGEPLTTLKVSNQAIDGLFETDTVKTPSGEVLDVTHALAALDVKVAGVTTKAKAAEALYDVKWTGVVTWAGDLASWFVEWVQQRPNIQTPQPTNSDELEGGPPEETGGLSPTDLQLLNDLAVNKTSKDDLLGDMDAEIMAEENVQPSTFEHVKAEGRPVKYSNIDTELTKPVSDILGQYYGIDKSGQPTKGSKPQSTQRFPNFLRKATPAIPYTVSGASVSLAAGAENAIMEAITNVAFMFIAQGTSGDARSTISRYDQVLREMARRFTHFLATGLATGDAPWPGPNTQGGTLPYPAAPKASAEPALQRMPAAIPTIQRDVADEHVLTADEEKELPSSADVPKLKKELADLNAEAAKLKKEGKTLEADKEKRRQDIPRLLRLRATKGDEAETLTVNGITTGAAAWFAEVKAVPFLGQTAVVHKQLADRLAKAESDLKDLKAPKGGWISEAPSGLRAPGAGLHSLGLAIDLNGSRNPWLINPDARGAKDYEMSALSTEIRDIIDRAILLVLGKTAAQADLQSRPTNADKAARVEASYDKLSEASGALKTYFEMAIPEKKKELEGLITRLGTSNPDKRSADDWVKVIENDKKALTVDAKAKQWQSPEQGFLNLDKRLVKALTDPSGAGLTWLGDDTIAAGRDIMHFDTRGVGPIKKIWKSSTNSSMGLGDG